MIKEITLKDAVEQWLKEHDCIGLKACESECDPESGNMCRLDDSTGLFPCGEVHNQCHPIDKNGNVLRKTLKGIVREYGKNHRYDGLYCDNAYECQCRLSDGEPMKERECEDGCIFGVCVYGKHSHDDYCIGFKGDSK